jgi:hypothetical protein
VLKIINTTFEDRDQNKKNLLNNIPKGFFDDPKKDYRFQLELEEEKEKESKKAQMKKEKKKIEDEKRQKENFNANKDNAEDKESEGENYDAALNEEISAMIECAEFLGNLTKKEKKKKFQKISFGESYGYEDQEEKEGKKDITKLLLGKKRNNDEKYDNGNKKDKKDNSEDDSVDMEEIFNTDFRNIN